MEKTKIIKRIPRRLIRKELTNEHLICKTNHGGNIVYRINNFDAPNTMQEIGRLREIAFRNAGGGTGQAVDIDEYDICNPPFEQLLVWNPLAREIVSSYRYILGKNIRVDNNNNVQSPVGELFHFSEKFIQEYLPKSIELGRSFVQPKYQASRKGIFALDNIWDGLGALLCMSPEIEYFYGKMTMYKSYNKLARDLILFFLQKHFSPKENLIQPIKPLNLYHKKNLLASILLADKFEDDYKILVRETNNLQCKIPPLVNIYMGLSPTMQFFGTSDNEEFGDVEESTILISIKDIYPIKKERHINCFKQQNEQ